MLNSPVHTRLVGGALALLATIAPLAARAQRTTAFTGFTLIDGTTAAPIANATLVVRGGRVVAVGPSAVVTVPAGAARVSLAGKTVIPGLVNAHGHVNAPADLATYAAYGVTTVYSLGGEPASVFAERTAQRTAAGAASLARSRVYVAGPVLTPTSPADARVKVSAAASQRVDIVKIRVDDDLGNAKKMAPDISRAVIAEAHRRGMRVATHLYYLADAHALLDAGTDFVAHSVRDLPVDDALVTKLKARGVCYSPTLMREVSTFVYESTPAFFEDSQFLRHANPAWVTMMRDSSRQASVRANRNAQLYKAGLPLAMRNLKTLADAGVGIAMGTDTGPVGRFQGYFELMELEMMVDAGLSPRAVLAAATRDAAKCMRIDADVGTLERGKFADFIALDASPLERIANVRKISAVYISGNRVAR